MDNFFDAQAWTNFGLPLTTTSDQACKLLDAGIAQLVSWRENEQLGGLEGTLKRLKEADPNFVMGRVFDVGLALLGTGETPRLSEELHNKLKGLQELYEKQKNTLTEREQQHVQAIDEFGKGSMTGAIAVWEGILRSNPKDMLAIKMAHDCYFYLGKQREMRDSILRVMPYWKESDPLANFLWGQLAFGYVETSMYDKAQQAALKGLELNRNDAWSTHAMAHVFEMSGEPDKGIEFMSKTVQDWEVCKLLSCHNFWHWGVYHIEKGEHDAATELFDGQIGCRAATSGMMLDYVDAASLLYRLELDGATVPERRWAQIFDVCKTHVNDHITVFNDAHFLMSILGMNAKLVDEQFRSDIVTYAFDVQGVADNVRITNNVGMKLFEAMQRYSEKDFDEAARVLIDARYDILSIGGSDAQRDVFHILMIAAAAQSQHYREYAKQLLYERAALRRNTPMVDRLRKRFSL